MSDNTQPNTSIILAIEATTRSPTPRPDELLTSCAAALLGLIDACRDRGVRDGSGVYTDANELELDRTILIVDLSAIPVIAILPYMVRSGYALAYLL
jgi:hypothetical protein